MLRIVAALSLLCALAGAQEDVRSRWVSLWRWRAVDTPAELGLPVGVTTDGAGDFLVLFTRAVARYDATGWTVLGTLVDVGTPVSCVPLGSGAAVRTDRGLYACAGGDSARHLLTHAGWEPPDAAAAGDRVLFLRGDEILALSADGTREVFAKPPGPVDRVFPDGVGGIWCTGPDEIHRLTAGAWRTFALPASHRGVTFGRIVPLDDSVLLTPWRKPAAPPLELRGGTATAWSLPPDVRGIGEAVRLREGLLAVTHQGGLLLRQEEEWIVLSTRGLDDGTVRSVARAGDRLLFRTARGRLYLHDAGSTRWETYPTWGAGISSMINVFAPSREGGVWVGTDSGIARWDGAAFRQVFTEGGGRSLAAITALHEDERGHLWVGSGSAFPGVLRYDGARWHHHTEAEGVGDWCVQRIVAGDGGEVWFLLLSQQFIPDGREGGVVRLRGGTWRRFTREDGLPSPRCYDLLPAMRTLLVGTADGVARLEGERWVSVGKERPAAFSIGAAPDGTIFAGAGLEIPQVFAYRGTWRPLPSPEGRPLAAAAMIWHGDRLWFASRRGLCAYDGEMVHRVSDEPGLSFSEFWPLHPMDDDSVLVGAWGYGLVRFRPDDATPPRTEDLETHRAPDGAVLVRWTGRDAWETTPPSHLRYRWRVDDGTWSDPTSATELRLDGLAPGPHRIDVECVDLLGNRERAAAAQEFDVPPPFWARADVRAGLAFGALVLAALLWVLLRYRAERRRGAVQLRRFRAILDHASESIFVVDPAAGRFLDVNEAAAKALGYTRDELLAMGPQDVQTKLPDIESFQAFAKRVRESGGQTVLLGEHRRKDGSTFPVEVAIRAGSLAGEEYFVAVARDIRDRLAAETQLRAAEESLRHAEKLKSLGVLAGGIAHDFNNLLVGILGNANLVRNRMQGNTPILEYVGGIETAAQRAADLCRQLLAYAGKGRSIVEPVDLAALAEETVRLLRVTIPKTIAVELALDRSVPRVQADAAQIRQIVMNLITNAAEAIGTNRGLIRLTHGSVTLAAADLEQVSVGAEMREGAYAFLEVADDGCGMDAETLARIFEPFFTTKFQGRGLGLAAVRGIVRSHQGGLTVTRAPGEGTTIRFLLPCPAGVPAVA
mgnify:CR=1 FL=1